MAKIRTPGWTRLARAAGVTVLVAAGIASVIHWDLMGVFSNEENTRKAWEWIERSSWIAGLAALLAAIVAIRQASTTNADTVHQSVASDTASADVAPSNEGSREVRAASTHQSMPAKDSMFTGRNVEIEMVLAAIDDTIRTGQRNFICAISGMPGVGKTALAIHIGHLLAPRSYDHQIFVDLCSYTSGVRPASPADTLASLLLLVGLPPEDIPPGLHDRIARWRNYTADKRILLILDNAIGSDQVLPLLPTSSEAVVVATSRRHLGDLPSLAFHMTLDTMSNVESTELFLRLTSNSACQPGKIEELVALCGHLPLAIRLMAGLLIKHQSWSIDNLVNEARSRLLMAKVENNTIKATFDMSYQHLPAERQYFFRHLGLHPGIDIDMYAGSALAGVTIDDAAVHLDRLFDDRLVDEYAYRRYRMHDLIGEYARTCAAEEAMGERHRSVLRLLSYYCATSLRAASQMCWHTRTSVVGLPLRGDGPEFSDREAALTWLRVERANLLACIAYAGQHDLHSMVVDLTLGVSSLLRSDGPWSLAVTLHSKAAASANSAGDRAREAISYSNLGIALHLTADYAGAERAERQALTIYREIGDALGEANALSSLGTIHRLTGNYSAAAEALAHALSAYRRIEDRLGEANTLNCLGKVRCTTGDHSGAIDAQEEALRIATALGHQNSQANAFNGLGVARYTAGDYDNAATDLMEAVTLFRKVENRAGEANALFNSARLNRFVGRLSEAKSLLEEGLAICRDISNLGGEVEILNEIGVLEHICGHISSAKRHHEEALDIARRIGSVEDEANSLYGLGYYYLLTGSATQAKQYFQAAIVLYRRMGAIESERAIMEIQSLS